MKRWMRLMCLLMLALLTTFSTAQAATPADWDKNNPQVLNGDYLYSESAVLIDADSMQVLFSKRATQRMYPASTTKMMTILLALESGIDLDTVITIPKAANDVPSDSSFVPVLPGEQMTFRDLLYGTMINSGNDGSNSIAVLVAGSVEGFVERMNTRAVELGCTRTHFVNPHGYHDEDHYTTALDLARIAAAAMKNETFREIVSATTYTMAPTSRRREKQLSTRNSLLRPESDFYYEDCIGIKTGYHSEAGQCYVSAAEHNGLMLIAVALKSDASQPNYKWRDAIRLFEYGWTRYAEYTVSELYNHSSYDFTSVVIPNAALDDPQNGTLDLELVKVSDEEYSIMVPDEEETLANVLKDFKGRVRMDLRQSLSAPIDEGEILGTLTYHPVRGADITGVLIAGRSVEARPQELVLQDVFPALRVLQDPIIQWIGIALIFLIVLLILVCVHRSRKQARRRREIYRENREEYERRFRRGDFEPEKKKRKRRKAAAKKREKDALFDIDDDF